MSNSSNRVPARTTDAERQPSPMPTKRDRAKRSCDLCRKRKTRCNADQIQPCGTCKNAGVECQFLVEQRKRGPGTSTNYVEFLEGRLRRLEGLLKDAQPEAEITKGFNGLKLTDYECTFYVGGSAGFHLLDQTLLASNQQHRVAQDPSWVIQKLNSETTTHVLLKTKLLSEKNSSTSSTLRRGRSLIDIPHMTTELADSMIYTYFRTVHPAFPIIHKMAFLEQYYFGNPQPPDKYLLLCVCWAASHYMINDHDLLETGHHYTSDMLLSIQKELRERCEYILQNAYRRPKISTVQSLLLLSHFISHVGEDDSDTFQWFACGNAIRMAQEMGLHLNATNWKIPENEIEQRRRLWYAIYMTDRDVAARLGRPVTIADDDFDVELPTPYELESTYQCPTREPEFQTFTPTLILEAQNAISERIILYDNFLQLISLSQILGHVLRSLYHPKMENAASHANYLTGSIDNKLARWKANLPKNLHFDEVSNTDTDMYLTGGMNIYYNFILLLLHRPLVTNRENADTTVAVQALSTCTSAAIAIADTINTLESKKMPIMPLGFASDALFQSALIFFIVGRSENQFMRHQGIQYLRYSSALFKQTEQLRHTLHSYMLADLVSKHSDNPVTEHPVGSKWHVEPVEPTAAGKQDQPTDRPQCGVTSDAGLYNTATPYALRCPTRRSPVEESFSPQATFDVSSASTDFSLAPALTWSEWERILQGSIYQ